MGVGHDPHVFSAPISQDVNAFAVISSKAVEFPDNDGFYLPIKYGFLQFLEGRTRGMG